MSLKEKLRWSLPEQLSDKMEQAAKVLTPVPATMGNVSE